MTQPTDEQLNQAICKWLKIVPKFAVQKGGLYYRPNSAGYTASLSDCGQYTYEEGSRELVRDEPMNLVPLPPPQHIHGTEARHNLTVAILRLTKEQRRELIKLPWNHHTGMKRDGLLDAIFALAFESTNTGFATALCRVVKPEIFQ